MSAPLPPSNNDVWLAARFSQYYRRNPPTLPDRFGKREFGFIFFGQKGMLRHVAFRARGDFERFHWERAPAHSYYSTAFYQRSDAPTMQEKGWLAAELIFDLDADHVPGAERLPYEQQLARVKQHFIRLVDEFVREDFGFDERDLLLTFSGGRGYHCHVLAEKALELTSQERREIVDYVTGTGLQLETYVHPSTVATEGGRRARKTMRVASAQSPGWGRRLNRGLTQYFLQLKALTPEARAQALAEVPGLGRTGRLEIERQLPLLTEQHMAGGFFDRGPAFQKLIHHAMQEQVIPLAKGETDEPVTSDTKRLIRTPGTLHGKSGLKVAALTRDELTDFDPLRDAVAFSDEPHRLRVLKPATVALKGEKLQLEPGETQAPEWAAVFAVMRGWAEPVLRTPAK